MARALNFRIPDSLAGSEVMIKTVASHALRIFRLSCNWDVTNEVVRREMRRMDQDTYDYYCVIMSGGGTFGSDTRGRSLRMKEHVMGCCAGDS
jgi:hypothetical protein